MASALERARLARAAARLNRRSRELPALILMTDEARADQILAAAAALPKGSAIILRHRDAAMRAQLGEELKRLAHSRELGLLVAGDAILAQHLGAGGLHLAEARLSEIPHWRARQPSWLITCAAHSERAALLGARFGADAALLAPVFPTQSHAGREGLGLARARAIALRASLPVYALGGVNAKSALRLQASAFAGLAAIEGLSVTLDGS